MAPMNAWMGSYAYDTALSTANLAATFWYNKIFWHYVYSSSRYTTYSDTTYSVSYFSLIDNKLAYAPLQLSCHLQGPKSIEFCWLSFQHKFYIM